MNALATVDKIAEVILYEGYLLFPYRPSAMKNQQRWTFGGVYPRAYSEACAETDPWWMQTQCLVEGTPDTRLDVRARFLRLADCAPTWLEPAGPRLVEGLRLAGRTHRPREEAIEGELLFASGAVRLGDLLGGGCSSVQDLAGGQATEPLAGVAGERAAALVRTWQPIQIELTLAAEPLPAEQLYRLTAKISNVTPWASPAPLGGEPARQAALRQSTISTHTVLQVEGGAFVSLLEPPPPFAAAASACANVKTWPVLVGERGERQALLSSPIILYDYPEVAPESPVSYFDTTEIDELLALSVLALTDEEKAEVRAADPRAREILERTERLTAEQLLQLHGTFREPRLPRREE